MVKTNSSNFVHNVSTIKQLDPIDLLGLCISRFVQNYHEFHTITTHFVRLPLFEIWCVPMKPPPHIGIALTGNAIMDSVHLTNHISKGAILRL